MSRSDHLPRCKLQEGEQVAGLCTCTYLPCAWCGEAYPALDPERMFETLQADGCDSTVWFDVKKGCWMIQGHYGSNQYDTTRFKFKRNPPNTDANPVCDRCVTDRLEQGDLEEVPGSFL